MAREVAPFAGAWIEIYTAMVHGQSQRSLPSRERGLKSELYMQKIMGHKSLPSRERGLK